MSDQLARILPAVFGVVLGWIIFHPPAWLEDLGPARYLVTLGAAFVVLVVLVATMILRNLPAAVSLRPLPPERVPPEVRRLAEEVVALGFFGAGPALEVGVSPAAVLMPLVSPAEHTYAAAYRTGTVPAVTALDFVSLLEVERGGLTTSADPRGGSLPAAPNELRQLIPGASPTELLSAHREALVWLRSRGLGCRAVTAGSFRADFAAAIAMQRRTFLASPLRGAVIAIWRSATGRTPHLGPLHRQAIAGRQITALLTGARG